MPAQEQDISSMKNFGDINFWSPFLTFQTITNKIKSRGWKKIKLKLKTISQKKLACSWNRTGDAWNAVWHSTSWPGILAKNDEELTNEGKVFGKPEKELIKSLLAEIEIENVGFYLDAKGRLCGAQTLRLSNASKVITMANKVLGRQLKARLPETKNFSPETITLIRKKLKDEFPFIRLSGNLLHLSMIMNRPDQVKFSENSLTQLPDGIRIDFSDEILSLKCGGIDNEKGTRSRECFLPQKRMIRVRIPASTA